MTSKPVTRRSAATVRSPPAHEPQDLLHRRDVGALQRPRAALPAVLPDPVAGTRLLAIATVALCVASVLLGAPMLMLPSWLPRLVYALIGTAVVVTACYRAGAMMAPVSVFWAAMVANDLLVSPRPLADLAELVRPAESAALLLTALAALRPKTAGIPRAVTAALAALLILFGLVHVSHAQDVAALVPVWMPRRTLVPLFTGAVLLAAGCAYVFVSTRGVASCLVIAMFTSWLVLVHAPRLQHALYVLDEWRFALTAVALIGALVRGRTGRTSSNPSRGRSKTWKSWH